MNLHRGRSEHLALLLKYIHTNVLLQYRKTIVRKAAQFITQPLFLFFTKAFSPLTLCLRAVCSNDLVNVFKVVARSRNSFHLDVLEAVFIKLHSPVLCQQKEFVKVLYLV